MLVNKMGSYHAEYGLNNQDAGFTIALEHGCPGRVSVVLDGCSEGEKSEIGAGLFAKIFEDRLRTMHGTGFDTVIKLAIDTFNEARNILVTGCDVKDLERYMLFTIAILVEYDTSWHVSICGDGCIILQDTSNDVKIIPVNHSSTPPYLAYRYLPCYLPEYEPFDDKLEDASITFTHQSYDKKDYRAVGIASDGLLAIVGKEGEPQLDKLIIDQNEVGVKRLINKLNYENRERGGFFKDDVTLIV